LPWPLLRTPASISPCTAPDRRATCSCGVRTWMRAVSVATLKGPVPPPTEASPRPPLTPAVRSQARKVMPGSTVPVKSWAGRNRSVVDVVEVDREDGRAGQGRDAVVGDLHGQAVRGQRLVVEPGAGGDGDPARAGVDHERAGGVAADDGKRQGLAGVGVAGGDD